MKILIFSDVHGNKYALEALKNTKDYKTADKKIFLGDSVSFCAYPNECIKILKDSNIEVLMGNHDVYCAFGIPKTELGKFNEGFLKHLDYIRNKVSEENKNYLKNLDYTIKFELSEKKFYFSHYLWKNKETVFANPDGKSKSTILTANLFESVDADYIFYGHNHTPSIVKKDKKTFICIGSLGVRSPGNYVILDIDNERIKFEHKKLEYDSKKLINEMLIMNYPGVNQIINFFNE